MLRASRLLFSQALPRVGLIGTGNIGTACGLGLLKKGYPLHVSDIAKANATNLINGGAQWHDRAANMVGQCDVVITALPAPPHVRDVMLQNGTLEAMRPGTCWIDHTTTSEDEVKQLAAHAKGRGLRVLEAPLTGGLQLLQKGMMTTLVGGNKDLLKEMQPILDSYIHTTIYVGELGSASVLKVITNMLCAINLVATGEALLLASKAGVDLQACFDGVRASAGNSFVFETEAPLVFNGTYDPGFTIGLHCKDLAIGRKIAEKYGVSNLDVMFKAEDVYRNAMQRFGSQVGSSSPVKLLEQDANHSLQIDGYDKWGYRIEVVEGGSIAVVHEGVEKPKQ